MHGLRNRLMYLLMIDFTINEYLRYLRYFCQFFQSTLWYFFLQSFISFLDLAQLLHPVAFFFSHFFFFYFLTTFFKFLWQPEKVLQLNAVLIIFQSKPFIHLGTICETEICDWRCCQANYSKITQICLNRLQFILLLDCLLFRSKGYAHLN